MSKQKDSGWYPNAKIIKTLNYDERPYQQQPWLLVIHSISLPPGEYGTGIVESFFCNELDPNKHSYFQGIFHLRVSSHLLIARTGEITQFVSFDQRAWHAGISSFQGKSACNDFSIGIELEGTDTDTFEHKQYLQLAKVTQHLMKSYPQITLDHIVGHSDIAPGRKTDPGIGFDWHKYRNLLTVTID